MRCTAAGTQTEQMRKAPALTFAAVAVAAMTGLSGCALADFAKNERESAFATTTVLAETWGKSAPWLPEDATDITTVEATNAANAVLLAASESELDPGLCSEVDRLSGPVYDRDWTPNGYAADRVWACGDWTVIAADGGWYGWTPGHPDEKAQSPAAK